MTNLRLIKDTLIPFPRYATEIERWHRYCSGTEQFVFAQSDDGAACAIGLRGHAPGVIQVALRGKFHEHHLGVALGQIETGFTLYKLVADEQLKEKKALQKEIKSLQKKLQTKNPGQFTKHEGRWAVRLPKEVDPKPDQVVKVRVKGTKALISVVLLQKLADGEAQEVWAFKNEY
jgi:hypothetical protein